MRDRSRFVVVGGGIFGATSARALAGRGHDVALVDPGPLPHPQAESTDISKVIRMEYGADAQYAAWMEHALSGWRAWNRRWSAPLFHETGVTFLSRRPLVPGGFEHESLRVLTSRGHRIERLDEAQISRRFPAWRGHLDGYFNPAGGFAESGRVVEALVEEAVSCGARLEVGEPVTRLAEHAGRVTGVILRSGRRVDADGVVVAAGAWSATICPELAPVFRSVGQPVFHVRPLDPALFEAARFPVFGADISQTGYYGFPITGAGVVKIANHGTGRDVDVLRDAREIAAHEEAQFRAFLRDTFPDLAEAPIVHRRVCVYCDTADGAFWIDRHPRRPGLTIAAGGSGHAFKFAPLLGDWIADVAEGIARPDLARFAWRDATSATEAARATSQPAPQPARREAT